MRGPWTRVATVVFLVAAVGFAAGVVAGQWDQLAALREQIGGFGWRLHPGWLSAAAALATANLFWMGLAWVRLYRSCGGDLGYARGVRVWLATNLGRYIPGKVWQLSGLALHLRDTGASGALAVTSALAFQVVALLTGGGVAAGTVGADLARLPRGSPWVAVVTLALLAALLHPRVVSAATRLVARLLGEEEPGRETVPSGRDLLALGGALTGAWVVYGAGMWCLMAGVMDEPPLGPVVLAGVFAASYVAGYLVLVAPGGLVVREGAMTALLAALAPLGGAVAGAVAVAARIWVTASEILGLGVALLLPGERGRAGPPGESRDHGSPGAGGHTRSPADGGGPA